MTKVTGTVPPDDEIISMVGEGIHAGIRKGTDAPEAPALWTAISESGGAWSEALSFFLWGMRYSGWEIVKRSPEPSADEDKKLFDEAALQTCNRKGSDFHPEIVPGDGHALSFITSEFHSGYSTLEDFAKTLLELERKGL